MSANSEDVAQVLHQITVGEDLAAEKLLPLLYNELRRLANARLANDSGQTLQATELVHEAYLRLVGDSEGQVWNSRGHFFGAAALAMRRILVDRARQRRAVKRGGDRQKLTLNEGDLVVEQDIDLLALDEALKKLEKHDRAAAELVNLRYFAGLTMPESAEALGISLRKAERNWTFAKSWLHARLAGD